MKKNGPSSTDGTAPRRRVFAWSVVGAIFLAIVALAWPSSEPPPASPPPAAPAPAEESADEDGPIAVESERSEESWLAERINEASH